MQSATELSKLWQSLITVDEVDYLVEELETALRQIKTADSTSSLNLLDILRSTTIDYLGVTSKTSLPELKEVLNKHLMELRQLNQVVAIEVAQEPAWGIVKLMGQRLKKRLGEKAVIKFSYNPLLIGGAAITRGGKYHDGSLRGLLDSLTSRKAGADGAV